MEREQNSGFKWPSLAYLAAATAVITATSVAVGTVATLLTQGAIISALTAMMSGAH